MFAVAALVFTAACSDETITPPVPSQSALLNAVTGAAAAALGQDGKIRLEAQGQAGDLVNASDAVTLATSWTRVYAPVTLGYIEKTHGAKIDTKSLRSCGRPLYARSPFVPPAPEMPAPYRRIYGDWWLVTFCDGAIPKMSVAVSAWAEVSVNDGKLDFPAFSGTEFFAVGIPQGHIGEYPLSPEAAVQLGSEQTGKRVSGVPELITPLHVDGPPQLARWNMRMEVPATMRGPAGDRRVDHLLISQARLGRLGVVLSAATTSQPNDTEQSWEPAPTPQENYKAYEARARAGRTKSKIIRRPDSPVSVELVSPTEDRP